MLKLRFSAAGISRRDAAKCCFAAATGAAAFPPLGLWPLSLASLYLFLRALRDKNSTDARAVGLVYGFLYGLGTMYWFFGLFGPSALALVFIMAGYFAILGTLIGATRCDSPGMRALQVAVFAMAIEWGRGDAWYLRFPWYTPAHALAQAPVWIACCRWIGTYGLSGAVWGIAAWAAFGKPTYALAYLVLPACALLLPAVEPPDQTAVLVQCEDSSKLGSLLSQIDMRGANLVVLPEYAYPYGIDTALKSGQGPVAVAQKLSCPVIFGTVEGTYGAPEFQNVAAVLDSQGELIGTFPKQRPVPLMIDGRPGDRCPVFPIPGAIFGIGLCYDFDAPAVAARLTAAGASVLVAPTGDLMSWGRVQHVNHELLVRLRAVENDRWILRATTSGRSEAIDPHGVPSAEHLDIGETGQVVAQYGSRSTFSLGGRMHLLGPMAAAVSVLLGLRGVCAHTRRENPTVPT
jgi:apolipoprotein N-acyltransferase